MQSMVHNADADKQTTDPREELAVKKEIFDAILARQASRRTVLRGMAGAGAIAAMHTPGLGGISQVFAQDSLRTEILKIPGVGMGSPTDADWQKVGELCLGPTKD